MQLSQSMRSLRATATSPALPSGKTASFPAVKADQFLDLNLNTSRASTVKLASNP
jgi:hypothetical protein